MLPNFICIGPGRAGTSWLYEVLAEHPQVRLARHIKETQFFNDNYHRGLKWYEEFFDYRDDGVRAVGEVSNRYFFHQEVPSRIKSCLPTCKIVTCLRNPYERIQSVYTFKVREGTLTSGFEEALLTRPELIEENRYFTLLQPYFGLFGEKSVHVLFYDDLVKDPVGTYRAIARFLDVDERFVPSRVRDKINEAVVPRSYRLAAMAKGVARGLRRAGFYRILTWAKRSNKIKNLLFRRFEYKQAGLMTPTAKIMIDAVVLPELERLESLVGPQVRIWKQTNVTLDGGRSWAGPVGDD